MRERTTWWVNPTGADEEDEWEEDLSVSPTCSCGAATSPLVKKADLTVKVARRMLGPTVTEDVIEDQAVALMGLSDSDLIETFARLADVTPPLDEKRWDD